MQSFKTSSFIFFTIACSHQKQPEIKALKSVTIKGLLVGQDSYQNWVVFVSSDKYRSPQYPVKANGSFNMVIPNLRQNDYQFHYGRKNAGDGYNSFKIPVYKPQINLGWVKTN